jgi:hypothetical protein
MHVGAHQTEKNHSLENGEYVIRQKPVQHDLPLGKRAREQEFDIRRFAYEASLQKAFKQRPQQHHQPASNQILPPDKLGNKFLVAKVKQETEQTHYR